MLLRTIERSRWYGPEAPRWLGPLPYEYPDWLPEDVPANYGFDVAALSAPEVHNWLQRCVHLVNTTCVQQEQVYRSQKL